MLDLRSVRRRLSRTTRESLPLKSTRGVPHFANMNCTMGKIPLSFLCSALATKSRTFSSQWSISTENNVIDPQKKLLSIPSTTSLPPMRELAYVRNLDTSSLRSGRVEPLWTSISGRRTGRQSTIKTRSSTNHIREGAEKLRRRQRGSESKERSIHQISSRCQRSKRPPFPAVTTKPRVSDPCSPWTQHSLGLALRGQVLSASWYNLGPTFDDWKAYKHRSWTRLTPFQRWRTNRDYPSRTLRVEQSR